MEAQLVEADVAVMVNLDAAGKVTRVRVISPSPHAEFNEVARAAAEAEQFEPAMKDGHAVPCSLAFTYRFRLEARPNPGSPPPASAVTSPVAPTP